MIKKSVREKPVRIIYSLRAIAYSFRSLVKAFCKVLVLSSATVSGKIITIVLIISADKKGKKKLRGRRIFEIDRCKRKAKLKPKKIECAGKLISIHQVRRNKWKITCFVHKLHSNGHDTHTFKQPSQFNKQSRQFHDTGRGGCLFIINQFIILLSHSHRGIETERPYNKTTVSKNGKSIGSLIMMPEPG